MGITDPINKSTATYSLVFFRTFLDTFKVKKSLSSDIDIVVFLNYVPALLQRVGALDLGGQVGVREEPCKIVQKIDKSITSPSSSSKPWLSFSGSHVVEDFKNCLKTESRRK